MTPDPLDQAHQRAARELDQQRRTDPNPFACHDSCGCKDDDAITTPLGPEDRE